MGYEPHFDNSGIVVKNCVSAVVTPANFFRRVLVTGRWRRAKPLATSVTATMLSGWTLAVHQRGIYFIRIGT
jgi:hypothetical protein